MYNLGIQQCAVLVGMAPVGEKIGPTEERKIHIDHRKLHFRGDFARFGHDLVLQDIAADMVFDFPLHREDRRRDHDVKLRGFLQRKIAFNDRAVGFAEIFGPVKGFGIVGAQHEYNDIRLKIKALTIQLFVDIGPVRR